MNLATALAISVLAISLASGTLGTTLPNCKTMVPGSPLKSSVMELKPPGWPSISPRSMPITRSAPEYPKIIRIGMFQAWEIM